MEFRKVKLGDAMSRNEGHLGVAAQGSECKSRGRKVALVRNIIAGIETENNDGEERDGWKRDSYYRAARMNLAAVAARAGSSGV